MALDTVRGIEGDASRVYFSVFNHLLLGDQEAFAFTKRSRRPPLDRINALLSFLYAMLANDARSACEATGPRRCRRIFCTVIVQGVPDWRLT